MTEFSGSAPVGGIKVTVDLDRALYDQKIQQLKNELAQTEKNARINFETANARGPNIASKPSNGDVSLGSPEHIAGIRLARTEQQRFYADQKAASGRLNIPKDTRDILKAAPQLVPTFAAKLGVTPQQLQAYLQNGQQPGGGGAPPGGSAPRPRAGPRGGGGGAPKPYRASRARRRSRRLKRMGAGRNRMPMGASRILSIYGITQAAEAILDFSKATIQANRSLAAANSDTGRIQATLQSRMAAESAARHIPFAGGLGVALRGLLDTAVGESPEDITRQDALTQQQDEYQNQRLAMGHARRRARAENYASSFVAGGSSEAMKAELDLQIQEQKEALDKQRAAELAKYTGEDVPNNFSTSNIFRRSLAQSFGLSLPIEDENGAIQRNKERDLKRNSINKDYDQQIALSTQGSDNQKKKIDFEVSTARMELDTRKKAAEQIQRFQFSMAEATKRVGDFKVELDHTPAELKKAFALTSIAETKAERSQLLSQVGSQYAESAVAGRDIFGDPMGIRDHNNPLDAINRAIRPMEVAAIYMGKIFDNGPLRSGR